MNNKTMLPKAVCLLVINEQRKVLAAGRRHDPTAFGLVGGKVDPGETLEQALVREVGEETGYKLTPDVLALVFKGVCQAEQPGGQDYETYTFTIPVEALGEQHEPKDKLNIQWVNVTSLFNGPFGNYNRELFAAITTRLVIR